MRLLVSKVVRLAAAAALVASQAMAADLASPADVPVEAFFNVQDMSEPVLSPQGDALAILLRNKAGRRVLAVLDTADLQKATLVAAFDDADVVDARWVND